jgi:hypothetical protein
VCSFFPFLSGIALFPFFNFRLDYAHRQHRQPDSRLAQAGQDSTGGVECQQIGIVAGSIASVLRCDSFIAARLLLNLSTNSAS